MKPGKLDLPTIWRGCIYPEVKIAWTDEDGDPIDLTGWTPRAYSRQFQFHARVADAFGGLTAVSIPIQTTRQMKLGKTDWDFIWTQDDLPQTTSMPFLRGNVEVKEPVTHPPSLVLGDIHGGSSYMKVIPGTAINPNSPPGRARAGSANFCLVGNYNVVMVDKLGVHFDVRSLVHQQLPVMYANGQRQISIVLWYYPPPDFDKIAQAEANHYVVGVGGFGNGVLPEADSYDSDGNPLGGHLWPQHQQNLIDILQLISDIGFEQVVIGYAMQGKCQPSSWGGVWQPRLYNIDLAFMKSTVRIVNAHSHGMEIIHNLGGEFIGDNMRPVGDDEHYPPHPGEPNDADRTVMRRFARQLWQDYTDEFGPAHSISFGIHGGTRLAGTSEEENTAYYRTNYWLDLLKEFNLPYPGYYRTEGYGAALFKLNPLFGENRLVVSGAGTKAVNGHYHPDGTKWVKGNFIIERGTLNWRLHDATGNYYTAPIPDPPTNFPYHLEWIRGPLGVLPVPLVAPEPKYVPTGGRKIIMYEGLTEVFRALKDHVPHQHSKPILVGETFYNNATVARQIEDALGDHPELKIAGVHQWTAILGHDQTLPFPDVYPKAFSNYLTI